MRTALFILWASMCCGCRYQLGSPAKLPGGFESVSVPAFVNASYEPGVEQAFTAAARAEIMRRGVADIVRERPDVWLMGRILLFEAVPSALVAQPGAAGKLIPQRYRAEAVVQVSLIATVTGEVLWEDKLKAYADFDGGGAEGLEGLTRKANQQRALARIASEIMHEAVDRILADF